MSLPLGGFLRLDDGAIRLRDSSSYLSTRGFPIPLRKAGGNLNHRDE